MSRAVASGEETGSGTEQIKDSPMGETVELRLPPRAHYLPVLRATLGVVAGNMSFDYDEILQLRVAVSEAFELAIEHSRAAGDAPGVDALAVTFVVHPASLEILVTDPDPVSGGAESARESESRAVLESLLDRVEFGVRAGGAKVTRMVKRRSRERSET